MIRIVKPAVGPAILVGSANRGPRATQEMKDAHDRGQRAFQFDSSIYSAKSVKRALIKAQCGKCCFCEAKVTHVAHGDVEHFRPKAAWVQDDGDPLARPGYYWLAYDWSNLLFCCQLCNQRHKRNLFPLREPAHRALSHHADVAQEEPLFVNPCDDDPELFISFRKEVAFAPNGNVRGERSIDALGLNRPPLVEHRLGALQKIELLRKSILLFRARRDDGTITDAERLLLVELDAQVADWRQSTAEYASMARTALAGL